MPRHRRSVSFALLLALAFWASGAACFLHELLEHADDAASPVSHVAAVGCDTAQSPDVSRGSDHPAHDGRHHGHDDCPTCLVLASLKADSASFTAPAVAALAPCGDATITRDESANTCTQTFLPPARAPPALHA